jgi:pimeloyl-ACP methyl ester carboxylesterase
MDTTELDWTFDGTWPHAPRWFETPEGRMHFVDVGPRAGRPVVLVHGNPTWGYLFRNFIPPLVAAGHRVIVPDHLGFGRSDQPDAPAVYRIERHAARLEALLDALDLRDATVVPHDWGGPIGLYWATRRPERVRSLAILNTFAHRPPGRVALSLPLRLSRARAIGELLVKGLHMVVRGFLFGGGVLRRERLTPTVRRAYLAPHRGWSQRTAILALAREFPADRTGRVADFQDAIHRGFSALASRPVFIAWATKDVVLGPAVFDQWRRDFPGAEVLSLPDVGHFLQEDAHEQVVPALVDFLARQR